MGAHGAPHDAVYPAPERCRAFQGVELRVDHDEDFLNYIVHRGRLDPEATRTRPDEVEILPVDGLKRGRYSGHGALTRIFPFKGGNASRSGISHGHPVS